MPVEIHNNPSAGPTGPSYVAAFAYDSTTGGHFTDQYGSPILWCASETWNLLVRGGEWTTPAGNYQLEFDTFFSQRSAQGVTVTMLDVINGNVATDDAPYASGHTWDNVSPWVTGSDAAGGLNSAFWTRVDTLFSSALAHGVSIGFTFNVEHDSAAGCAFAGWTNAQFQTYAAAVGARYASQPNLVWLLGNDNEPGTANYDNQMGAILTGLASVGANQVKGIWWNGEYTSRYDTYANTPASFGIANSDFNFGYTYNCSYFVMEYAYGEVANEGAARMLAPVWGDGTWSTGWNTYSSTYVRAVRQETWWSLAAGARGILSESEAVFQWTSTSPAWVTEEWMFANSLPYIVSYFTSLPGWWNLMPDLSSALVTGGRGTRCPPEPSGGGFTGYEPAFTNSWVAASVTADKSLAVMYLPNPTTITIDQTQIAAGYSATWVDPVNCTTYPATVGSTYNSGAADGTKPVSNSQGDPDWVLVLKGP